jgi:hypothetical protein
MRHYNIFDTFADDHTRTDRSVGIAQIRVDTIRKHATLRPDLYGPLANMSDDVIGQLLIAPEVAIKILALEIRYFTITSMTDSWEIRDNAGRRKMAIGMTAAKDLDIYSSTDTGFGLTWGGPAYDYVSGTGDFKKPK